MSEKQIIQTLFCDIWHGYNITLNNM